MLIFNGINSRNIILKYLYYIFISIKGIICVKLIDIKKLSLYDSYFVALDTGLYLYDLNTYDCALIYEFDNSKITVSTKSLNITEFYDGNNAYIFCLVKEHLFIFNEKTNKTFNYIINEITENDYYNIMPYKIENNNINFIIAFNNDTSNLIFYYYDFNLYENISEPKEIIIENMNIRNKMVRCQLNSYKSFIKCFYYSKINGENNYFSYSKFSINNTNIQKEETKNITVENTINQIKSAMSYNNNFLICFFIIKNEKENKPFCYINDYETNELNKINCSYRNYGNGSKVFYFNETGDFMFISVKVLYTTLFNSFNNSMKYCNEKNIFNEQSDQYSIIYNNSFVLNKTNNYIVYMLMEIIK